MQFLTEHLWTAIEKMGKRDGPRRVAVAYLSCDKRFRLRPGDVVVVNASDDAIKGGQTSASVLDSAWKAGVKQLYSNPRLHAKVIITPEEVLVGSANLSQNSPSLIEAALLSADEDIRAAVETWWSWLLQESTRINAAFLKSCAYWCSLRGAAETANKRGQTVYLPQANTFSVVGLRELMTRVARNEVWCDGSE